MTPPTLVAHLTTRFSAHPENLATESLHFVLHNSSVARRAFIRYVNQTGSALPEGLTFLTQSHGDDSAIPDLVGLDDAGRPLLIGEAKFWAGLTDHQPVTYLRRLPADAGAILLFVAPERRIVSLWAELVGRCKAADVALDFGRDEVAGGVKVASVEGRRTLAITSWPSVLHAVSYALETERELGAAANVAQLAGLCARMDDDAFIPLRSEDLTGDIGSRVSQFNELVDAATTVCATEGVADVGGLRSGSGAGWYGRYMRLGGAMCCLCFSAYKWSAYRATPLCLTVLDEQERWRPSPAVREGLGTFEREVPPRLLVDELGVHVPIGLPIGAERDRVVAHVAAQVRQVADRLRQLDRPQVDSAATP